MKSIFLFLKRVGGDILSFFGLKNVASDFLDLLRISSFRIVIPHERLKFRAINAIRRRTGSRTFIETGTQYGNTAERASLVFQKVYTIELHEGLYQQASRRLASRKNVEVIQGDAREVLPRLLEEKEIREAFVYLDGHCDNADAPAHGLQPEPAVEELKTLAKHRDKINAILVDDFRCFGTLPDRPSKSELLKCAEELFPHPNFEIGVHLDQLYIVRKDPGEERSFWNVQ